MLAAVIKLFSKVMHLQSRTMNLNVCQYMLSTRLLDGRTYHLVVHSQLTARIRDDQDSHTSTAIGKHLSQTSKEIALIQRAHSLLSVTSFGHGHHTVVVTDVKHTILLVHRSQHVLDIHGRTRVADET